MVSTIISRCIRTIVCVSVSRCHHCCSRVVRVAVVLLLVLFAIIVVFALVVVVVAVGELVHCFGCICGSRDGRGIGQDT